MERLENSRSKRTTNGSKSKKTLPQFSPAGRIIDLLKTLEILNPLKLTGH